MSGAACRECAVPLFKNPTAGKKAYACTSCHDALCDRHAYYYFDSCNIAITNSARPYCMGCYTDRHAHKGAK